MTSAMEFPRDIWRLIRRFAHEPTPSAKAFLAALQGEDVVEAKAPMRCCECQAQLPKCFRKWSFAEDGRVTMHFRAKGGLRRWCKEDVCGPDDTRLIQSDMCIWCDP